MGTVVTHSTPINVCRTHGIVVGPRCKCPGPHPEVKVDCPDEARCLARLESQATKTSEAAERFAEGIRNGGRGYVWSPPYGELHQTGDVDFSRRDYILHALRNGMVQTGWVPALVAPVASRRVRPTTKASTEAAALLREAAEKLWIARSHGDGESAAERGEWEQIAQAVSYFADCLVGPSDS